MKIWHIIFAAKKIQTIRRKKMITDKDGKEMSLSEVLSFLVGTDDMDMAKSVIDFAVYTINEDKTVGDPQYYLVANEAIVTNISFMGPFTMLEIDFRNIGSEILNQVMNVINKFHTDINYDNLLMLSTITSLDKDATHIMSLANPLTCVRGFSSEGKSSTLVQMIFATDNVGFTVSDIDYTKIDADIEREIQELEATSVTKEAEEAAHEIYDENNEEMKNVFTPEFGFRTDADRRERQVSGVRTSFGNETDKVESRKATKIGSANDARIKGVRETDEDDENIPDNRV